MADSPSDDDYDGKAIGVAAYALAKPEKERVRSGAGASPRKSLFLKASPNSFMAN
jgi:hypothetical protein